MGSGEHVIVYEELLDGTWRASVGALVVHGTKPAECRTHIRQRLIGTGKSAEEFSEKFERKGAKKR